MQPVVQPFTNQLFVLGSLHLDLALVTAERKPRDEARMISCHKLFFISRLHRPIIFA